MYLVVQDLYHFTRSLKSLIQGSDIVVVMTMPAYLYNDFYNAAPNPFVRRIEYIADCVLEVESFAGILYILKRE